MDRRVFAVWSLVLGLLLGLIGMVFFYGRPLGLSVPLFALVATGVLLALARRVGLPLRARNLWPLLPLFFFAGMIAVRDDSSLASLNIMAVFALGALVLHYLPGQRVIDEDSAADYVRGSLAASGRIAFLPPLEGLRALKWLRQARPLRGRELIAIGRGLLLTVPLLLVFALLLGSADAVFGDYLYQLERLFIQVDVSVIDRALVVGVLAWLGCGALACGVGRWVAAREEERATTPTGADAGDESSAGDGFSGMALPSLLAAEAQPAVALAGAYPGAEAGLHFGPRQMPHTTEREPERPRRAKKHPFVLGMIEASIMLAAVDLLFGAFVLVQFTYFFGGQANITSTGFTYAEYARRGFFELVVVSVLTLGLVLWLDWVTVRHNTRQTRLFQALALMLVALIGVMLWSASSRMTLYEQAFGLTHLRVYTHVFMFWLGVLFLVFLLELFRVRGHVFSVGLLVVLIGYLGTLGLMNVEGLIAGKNVERYLADPQTNDLDICYLRTMSADAAPAMLAVFQSPQTKPEIREIAGWWLRDELESLDVWRRDQDVFSFHLARAAAWEHSWTRFVSNCRRRAGRAVHTAAMPRHPAAIRVCGNGENKNRRLACQVNRCFLERDGET